jgi:hypothetical protein
MCLSHDAQSNDARASGVGGAIDQSFKRGDIDISVFFKRGRQHKVNTVQASIGGQFGLLVLLAGVGGDKLLVEDL